jgi:FlaA1/EpsC-like NDP-sugar epimerase
MRNLIITYRRLFVVSVHVALWAASFVLAFLLRFEFEIPPFYWARLPMWLASLLAIRIVVHWYVGLFHGLWRYSGTRDLINMLKASTASAALFVVAIMFFGPKGFPRTIFVIDWLVSIMLVGGLRFGIRTIREIAATAATAALDTQGRKKILVVGAGDAGEMLMREMTRAQHARRYDPVGFVDDNRAKHGERIHGVPVLGPIAKVSELVEKHGVDEVVIAIPSMTGREMRQVVEICQKAGVVLRTVPGVDHLIDGKVNVSQLQEVKIEDLLGRAPVELDMNSLQEFLRGKTVLVTGAGGSIGSELCRQVCRFGPARIVLVEQAENALFHIHRNLRQAYPEVTVVPCIADICDAKRLETVFAKEKPGVVFHAAAHKHVPMMEWNPGEAIKNNVFGTKKVADLADRYGAEKFVMVSTDKAVNPTSIMGVSKRTAEIYVQALSQRSRTHYVTVRFGNVLGSEGSVVPIFKEQIAKGGPVTVTHPEMKRYFMTIPEACQLVLQAGSMGEGGEIFVLDMGEPVKIVDLARDLIKLSGLKPGEDIEIRFTGLRPGEKLFEELSIDGENADKTKHPKIFVGRFKAHAWQDVERGLAELHPLTEAGDLSEIRAAFSRLVPEFKPTVDARRISSPGEEPKKSETKEYDVTALN